MKPNNELAGITRYIARCTSCNAYLDIREAEVAYTCPRCGHSYHETPDGMRPVETRFVLASDDQEPVEGRPFWEFQVEMPLSLASVLAWDMMQLALSVYVPAFDLPWEEAFQTGLNLTLWQPEYAPTSGGTLRGCIVSQQRALEAAQIIYVHLLERAGILSIGPDLALPPLISSRITVIPFRQGEKQP